MKYRIGLDLGTNSIGWAVLELDANGEPSALKDMGARIFPNGRKPQDDTSLAVDRRVARSARRRSNRYKKRRYRLTQLLVSLNLLPRDDETDERERVQNMEPYKLRAKALSQKLEPYELGRALFHLNQRRGFKSNRKVDGGADEEAGKIRKGVETLKKHLEDGTDPATLGQYLYQNLQDGKPVRFKPEVTAFDKVGKSKKGSENTESQPEEVESIYPSREMLEEELKHIRDYQKAHHNLSPEDWDAIEDTILFQRPLLPVVPGWCTLNPEERRAPRALPSVQRFRILQELANLKLDNKPLTKDEINTLADMLMDPKSMDKKHQVSFAKMRKALKADRFAKFNLEDPKRKGLKGDETAYILSEQELFGDRWFEMKRGEQDAVVEELLKGLEVEGKMNAFQLWKEEQKQTNKLAESAAKKWNLTPERAKRLLDTPLPVGHANYSKKVIEELLPFMEEDSYYMEAERPIGVYDAIQLHPEYKGLPDAVGEGSSDQLPYYGKILHKSTMGGDGKSENDEENYGKIANPTVHIALNQLRRVANAIINEYGKPESVIIETSRELKKSKAAKESAIKIQTKNQEANVENAQRIIDAGGVPTPFLLRKIALWGEQGQEQARICPYCGKNISFEMAMKATTEIDHILPYSQSLDDSRANKVVAHWECNRKKKDRSPYQAWGGLEEGEYAHEKILGRVKEWDSRKKQRFQKDADENAEQGFLDRQSTDNSYISKAAREYLTDICKDVQGVPGTLTSMLRKRWGLNKIISDNVREYTYPQETPGLLETLSQFPKYEVPAHLLPDKLRSEMELKEYDRPHFKVSNGEVIFRVFLKDRTDHRHHAIDAFVVGMTSRSMVKTIADAAKSYNPETSRENIILLWPEIPYNGFFHSQFKRDLDAINVSHKLNRMQPGKVQRRKGRDSTSGELHEGTAYGLVDNEPSGTVVTNKPLNSFDGKSLQKVFKDKDNVGQSGYIADADLREALKALWDEISDEGKDTGTEKFNQFCEQAKRPDALERFGFRGAKGGVKSVRIRKVLNITIPIKDKDGKTYKVYNSGGNAFMDVYRLLNGKWDAVTVPKFYANQPIEDFQAWYQNYRPHPAAKKVMRLFINDCLALEEDGQTKVYRIQQISGANLYMSELKEANVDARNRNKKDRYRMKKISVNELRKLDARRIHIDELGRIHDPGPNPG